MTTNGKPKNLASVFDQFKADYAMSKQSRFVRRRTGLAPAGGTADYHYRNESKYYEDMEKARDMDRNDCIVAQIMDRSTENEVQEGFTLDVKTGDKAIDADLKVYWNEYSNDAEQCDIAGEFTFHDMEHHVTRSAKLDGDMWALGLENGQLQLLEGHTIQTTSRINNVVLGVEIDQYRRKQKVYVRRDGTDPYDQKTTAEPVSIYDANGQRVVFQVYNPRRVTMTRGVTALAQIFEISAMFEDTQFATLVQRQVLSCFAVFRSQQFNPQGDSPPSVDGYGESSTETTESGTRYIEGVSPGMEIIGAPGEALEGFSPNVPGGQFFEHTRLLLQIIGVNLGLPLCLVLMDGSETNFSGWRGAVDEARKGWKCNQLNLISRFHTPVWKWKVRQLMDMDPALAAAAERSDVNIFAHKWNPPAWRYIEPLTDAQGDSWRIQNALTSPRRLHAERGAEWEEVADEIVTDNATAIIAAKKQAMEINQQLDDGQPVHWRELISLPMPNGLQMTMQDPQLIETQRGKEGI